MAQVAVVLMNLGGPDSLDAVRPFLVNLFNDPAIIDVPSVLRWPLARLIAPRTGPRRQARASDCRPLDHICEKTPLRGFAAVTFRVLIAGRPGI